MYLDSKLDKPNRTGLTRQFNAEWRSWLAMRQRCSNPRTVGWADYGGRGIKVCRRWKSSFANFLKDMGPKPTPQHSIDRKDVDKNYTPSNCRWATKLDQARNCRSNRYVTFNKKTMCLSAWADETGLSESLIRARLNIGWTVQKTLTTPRGARRHDQIELTYKGETKPLKQWARLLGVNYTTLLYRVETGLSPSEVIENPHRYSRG